MNRSKGGAEDWLKITSNGSSRTSSSSTRDGRIYYGWFVLGANFLATLGFGLFFSFGVFYTPLLNEFGWTKAQTGSLVALADLVQSLGGLGMGALTDRFGPRKVLMLGSGLLGAGAVLSASSSLLWEWYFFYGIVAGLGWAVIATVPMSVAVRWFPRRRALATGITTSGSGMGNTVLPSISAYLLGLYGWRGALSTLGVLFSALLLVSSIIAKTPARGDLNETIAETRNKAVAEDRILRRSLQKPTLWLLFMLFLLPAFGLLIVLTYLPSLGIARGMTPLVAAGLVGLVGAVSIVSRIGAFLVAKRLGTVASIIMATAMMALSTIIPFASFTMYSLYAFAILYGAGYGLWVPLVPSATGEIFGQTHYGKIWGVVNAGGGVGGVLGPVVAGVFLDLGGFDLLLLPMAGAVTGVGAILAFVLLKTTKVGAKD